MTEDETGACHHQLDGYELSKLWQLVMDREAWRGNRDTCSLCVRRESGMTK